MTENKDAIFMFRCSTEAFAWAEMRAQELRISRSELARRMFTYAARNMTKEEMADARGGTVS